MIETTIGCSDVQPANFEEYARTLPGYEHFAGKWAGGPLEVGLVDFDEWPLFGAFTAAEKSFVHVLSVDFRRAAIVAPQVVIAALALESRISDCFTLIARRDVGQLLGTTGHADQVELCAWLVKLWPKTGRTTSFDQVDAVMAAAGGFNVRALRYTVELIDANPELALEDAIEATLRVLA